MANSCIPSYSGGWGRRIAWTLKVEAAVSWDHAIVLQPGQQEQDSVSQQKKEEEENKKDPRSQFSISLNYYCLKTISEKLPIGYYIHYLVQ